MNLKRSFAYPTIFSLCILLICALIFQINPDLIYKRIWYFIIYFYFISILILTLLNFAVSKSKGSIMTYYLGTMVIRFFLSAALILVFMLIDRQEIVLIAVNFMALYLIYLGFDIFIIITKFARSLNNDRVSGDARDKNH